MRVKPAFWAFLAKKGLFRPFSASQRRGFTSTPPGPSPGAGEPLPGSGSLGTGVPGVRGGPETSGVPGSQDGVRETAPARAGRPRETPGPVPGGGAYGVLHQPLAPAPRGSREGPGSPGVAPGPRGILRGPPRRSWDRPSPGEGSPGYRGAPARGVDVKPLPGVPGIRDFCPLFGDFPQNRGFGPLLAR